MSYTLLPTLIVAVLFDVNIFLNFSWKSDCVLPKETKFGLFGQNLLNV